jgi:hypothetical protein
MPHPAPTPEYTRYISKRLCDISNRLNSTDVTDKEREAIKTDFKDIEEYLFLAQKKALYDDIRKNPQNYLSTPWDPLEGFLDTIYLTGCYISEFLDFLVQSIKKLLEYSASKSKELLDKESDSSHKFSFCSIFSKDNDKPNAVPYTGEYQCSLKMK